MSTITSHFLMAVVVEAFRRVHAEFIALVLAFANFWLILLHGNSTNRFQSDLETQLGSLSQNFTRFVITAGNPNAVAVQTLAYFDGTTVVTPTNGTSHVLDAGQNFSSDVVTQNVNSLVFTTCNPCPHGQYVSTPT